MHPIDLRIGLQALIEHFNVHRVIVFDDAWRPVPSFQRKLMPETVRYERCLIPAAALAGFADVTAVFAGMPLPPELAAATGIAAEAGRHDFRVLANHHGNWLDLAHLSPERHWDCALSDSAPWVPAPELEAFVEGLGANRTALLLPFQTLEHHHRRFGDRFLLLDAADPFNHKNTAIAHMEHHGYTKHVARGHPVPPDEPEKYSRRILELVDRYTASGVRPYVKVSSRCVGGFGNVSRSEEPLLYESTAPMPTRVAALRSLLERKQLNTETEEGRVEERLDKATDWLGHRELTVGGFVVDGVPISTYVGRLVSDGFDIFTGMVHSSEPSMIGLNEEEVPALLEVAADLTAGLVKAGYRTGYTSFDIIQTPDGGLVTTDFNLRRGGRSVAEAMLMHRPGSYYDLELRVHAKERPTALRAADEAAKSARATLYATSAAAAPGGTMNVLLPSTALDWSEALHSSARRWVDEQLGEAFTIC